MKVLNNTIKLNHKIINDLKFLKWIDKEIIMINLFKKIIDKFKIIIQENENDKNIFENIKKKNIFY